MIHEVHTDVISSFSNLFVAGARPLLLELGEIQFEIQKVYLFFGTFRENGD
jgi:hypothetical protein